MWRGRRRGVGRADGKRCGLGNGETDEYGRCLFVSSYLSDAERQRKDGVVRCDLVSMMQISGAR